MIRNHVVVDGSNIATEGRSSPSLRQLDEAVRAFLEEHPTDHVTVVVDATFGHRIDESERPEFENAVNASELITAPAGAIGRGDAFVLQVADKGDATILSNDSFQEFHGQYPWLFEEGRLIGGKPVPPVGWVFLLRSPVRGPTSRRAVKDAQDAKAGRGKKAKKEPRSKDKDKAKDREPRSKDKDKAKQKDRSDRGSGKKSTSGRERDKPKSKAKAAEPLNEPLPFIEFVGAHPIGTAVEGEVVSFSSHGAYVEAAGVHCYVPLKLMGDPAPRSAKDVLRVGETRTFVVHAFDVPRRGIDLAMTADDARREQKTSPEQEDHAPAKQRASTTSTPRTRSKKIATKKSASVSSAPTLDLVLTPAEEETTKTNTKASGLATTTHADQSAEEAPVTPARKKAAAKKAARKTAAKRGSKKATAKRTTKKKASAKKRSAAKRSTKKRSTAKRGAKKAAKKRPSKKRATKKRATKKRAAKKRPAKKRASKKRAPARKKKAASKKSTSKKSASRKRPAKRKASAKKRSTRRR